MVEWIVYLEMETGSTVHKMMRGCAACIPLHINTNQWLIQLSCLQQLSH